MTATERSIRILHVDDDEAVADVAARFLERARDEFVVETPSYLERAFPRVPSGGIDCIFSDFDMPELDGPALLASARDDAPALPFILYSGMRSEHFPR
jgi:DNA-binding NtrC family response regulator